MAARELIDIILRIRKEGTGGKDTTDELKGVDKAAKKAKAGVDGLSKSWKMGMAAAAGIAGALATLKKAYDFGKEGAAILQTRDSFDRLMVSMGAGPDVLAKLQAASRGTVDDMTLMSSTMTLLAGTSETMGRAIVDASPRLMEIAKAANKLNPALGTTAQMYNSIATGVKRAQPLILDNLGLTIKVGAANEKYAASIGKTVEQLTAEEKTMAILAATLEAGDRMIQQVGGSTEAMGDSFAEAEVQIKNATDELKTKFAPAVAEVVGFLANMVTGLEKTQEATDALIGSADSYDEYLDAVLAVAQANDQLFQQDVDQIKKQAELGEEYHRTVTAMGILTEEQWKSYDAVETLAGGIENLSNMQDDTVYTTQELGEALTSAAEPIEIVTEASQAAATAFYEAGDAAAIQQSHLEGLVAKAQAVADAERDAALASDEFKGSLDNLHMAISGEVGDAYDDYKQKVEDLDQALADGELSSKDYKSAIDDETQAFRDNTAAIIFNIAQKQILDALEKGLIEDVNNSGTAFDEANDILWILADTLGIVDEETLALMKTVQDDTQAMIDGTISAETLALRLGDTAYQARDAALGMDDLRSGIQNIPEYKKFVFETHYTTTGTPSGEGGPGYTPPPPPQMMQHGGQFLVRGAAGPDRVPVNFMATRGEVVTVTPVGGQAPADPSVTNNYNLTLNSQAGSQGVIRDFDIMQSM